MNVLHLSPRYNRDSILKFGLQPTRVKLDSHVKAFEKLGLIDYRDQGLIYTWEDCDQNDKFAKDMVYTIVWLHGRNKISKDLPDDFDFKDLHINPIYKYDQMIFDLYVGETYDKESEFIHEQRSMGRNWTSYGMDEKYEHNDKKLHMLKIPHMVKAIGEYTYRFDRGKVVIK